MFGMEVFMINGLSEEIGNEEYDYDNDHDEKKRLFILLKKGDPHHINWLEKDTD